MKPESSKTPKENSKISRISLQILQPEAGGKENLVGGSRTPLMDTKDKMKLGGKKQLIKDIAENVLQKEKKKKVTNKSVQTGDENAVDVKDLTSVEPQGANYWKTLAEKRRAALEEALKENEALYEKIQVLEQEKNTIQIMYEEAKNAMEVLKEVLEGSDCEED